MKQVHREAIDMDQGVKLYRSDCLEVLRTLDAGSIDAVVSDPPYNISRPDINFRNPRHAGKHSKTFTLHFGEWDYGFSPSLYAHELKRLLADNGQLYIFTSSVLLPEWITALRDSFEWKVLVWCKPDPRPQIRKRHWTNAVEYVLWFWRGRYTFNFAGHKAMYSWKMLCAPGKNRSPRYHVNEKPVALLSDYIYASTNAGDVILDPFMGSVSTGVACVQTGRRFIGVEIDSDTFKIAQRRIAEAQAAQLAATEAA